MNLDPTILARVQFAFTVSFHIIFPTISIMAVSAAAHARRRISQVRFSSREWALSTSLSAAGRFRWARRLPLCSSPVRCS
jgi:hypothetical protein